jgi:hypothetical protein
LASRWIRDTLLVFLCSVLGIPLALHGAEVDSLTARYSLRRDALDRINRIMNERLAQGVAAANEKEEGCDADTLYTELKDAVGQSFFLVGHRIAQQLNEDELIARDHTPLARSVYQDLAFLTGISMYFADLMSTVRVAGHEVGLDKFGHFFSEGWSYFELAYLDDEGIAAAMDWGEGTERTYYGWITTGIYSYADLTANFNGMRFWRRVLGNGEDPVAPEHASDAYVACQEGRWTLQQRLDLGEYIDGAWDEGNNCAEFSTGENEARFQARVSRLEARYLHRFTCPVSPPHCQATRQKYGELAPRLLHPTCLAASETWSETLVRWARYVMGTVWTPLIGLWERLVGGESKAE